MAFVNTGGTAAPKAIASKPKPKPKPAQTAAQKAAATKLKQRKLLKKLNQTLYNPSAVLTGSDLHRAANILTEQAINPQLRSLDRQTQDVTQQGKALSGRVSDYYKQLATQEAQGLATSQAISGRLNTTLAGIGGSVQDAIAAKTQGYQDALARAAAQRGAGLGGGTETNLAGQQTGLAANAASQSQAAQVTGALSGANWDQYGNALVGSNAARGGEAIASVTRDTQRQQRDIANRRADVLAGRGATWTKFLTDLRQGQFENQATLAGLGIKQQDLAAQQAAISQREAASRRQSATTKRGQDIAAKTARKNAKLAAKTQVATTRARLAVTLRGQTLSHQDRQAATAVRKAAAAAQRERAATGGGGRARVAPQNTASGRKLLQSAAKGLIGLYHGGRVTRTEAIKRMRAYGFPAWAVTQAIHNFERNVRNPWKAAGVTRPLPSGTVRAHVGTT